MERPRRPVVRTSPFHGGNTGSNPVGDAKQINSLDDIQSFACSKRDAIVTFSRASGYFPPLTGRAGSLTIGRMKAHRLLLLTLVGCCCLPSLRAQSNTPQSAQDAALLSQWVSTLRKQAVRGNADAQGMLGVFYYYGFGGEQDYAKSAVWFRKAAIQGDSAAQGTLGDLYLQGDGVPQSFAEAYFWLDLAAASPPQIGESLPPGAAKELEGKLQKMSAQALIQDRDAAASHLTRAELIRAQERAQKWFESHKPRPSGK